MGVFDKIKDAASDMSTRMEELKIKILLTSGRQAFHLGFYEKYIVLRVNDKNFIYFDDIEGLYKVTNFEWAGIKYDSVSSTNADEKQKGSIKRGGRLTGALVGTAIMPGVGTMVGAMIGNGNKKTKNRTRSNETTVNSEREAASPAFMTIYDPSENVELTFGFDCDSKMYGDLMNVFHRCWMQND